MPGFQPVRSKTKTNHMLKLCEIGRNARKIISFIISHSNSLCSFPLLEIANVVKQKGYRNCEKFDETRDFIPLIHNFITRYPLCYFCSFFKLETVNAAKQKVLQTQIQANR